MYGASELGLLIVAVELVCPHIEATFGAFRLCVEISHVYELLEAWNHGTAGMGEFVLMDNSRFFNGQAIGHALRFGRLTDIVEVKGDGYHDKDPHDENHHHHLEKGESA